MHAPSLVDVASALVSLVAALAVPPNDAPPEPRSGHAIVYDSTRKTVLLVNGDHATEKGQPGRLQSWDGRAWKTLDAAAPTPRTLSAVAFDSRRGRLVIQGGLGVGDDLPGDTLEWGGAASTTPASKWHRIEDAPSGGPGVRNHHAMAFDAARGVAVLFGGQDRDIRMLGDTWEWNGKTWKRVATTGPAARVHHALVYDSARKKTLLFGGSDTSRSYGDFWEWDGAAWKEISAPRAPSPRTACRMAFDEEKGEVVLFGGFRADPGPFIWDGANWRREPSGPTARSHHAMTYDAARGRIVLFGGYVGETNAADTWERDHEGTWTRVDPPK